MSPTGDLPTMAACNYSNNSYSGAQMVADAQVFSGTLGNQQAPTLEEMYRRHQLADPLSNNALLARMKARRDQSIATTEEEDPMPSRRIVQVYIADPSEDVPLAKSVLYTGEQKMTDLTDQELFFEIDIRDLLAEHNEARGKIVNKKVKDRTEYLEPIKVRDLKMVVVTIASF